MKYDFSVLSIKQQHQAMFKFLESEQRMLWDQFLKDIDHAANKVWSIGCQNTVDRILENAMLVGPAPWKSVAWPAVGSGLWANLWYAAQLVNTPKSIPPAEFDEIEDQMSGKGMIEKKTIFYLTGKYQDTRIAMLDYVTKRRKAGAFNIDGEPDPECTCAMTEASFFACEVHGENAKATVEEIWPETKVWKTLPKNANVKMVHCTCQGSWSVQIVAACPIHGVDAAKQTPKQKPLPF